MRRGRVTGSWGISEGAECLREDGGIIFAFWDDVGIIKL